MGSFPTVLGKEGKYHQEEDENKELRKREGGGRQDTVGRVLNGVPDKDMHICVNTENMLIFSCSKEIQNLTVTKQSF